MDPARMLSHRREQWEQMSTDGLLGRVTPGVFLTFVSLSFTLWAPASTSGSGYLHRRSIRLQLLRL